MNTRCTPALILLFSSALFAADPQTIWSALEHPAFDAAKTAAVHGLVLQRDRIKIVLDDGTIQFSQPVEGLVIAAAFRGHGTVTVTAAHSMESQQLALHTGSNNLEMPFSEAAFAFTDSTFEELSGKLTFSAGDPKLADLFQSRLKDGEDTGAEMIPRIFKSLLSGDRKRTAYFFADLKTEKRGWVQVRYDALEPEEIRAGRWADMLGYRRFDIWTEFAAGSRPLREIWRDPLARHDYDIPSYVIDAAVADNAELRATARLNLQYRAAGESVLLFYLDANLRVDSVLDAHANKLPYFQPREPRDRGNSYGDYVAVVLPQQTVAGDHQVLEFHYAGKRVVRKVGSGNFFCESFGWYPAIRDSFATRSNFEINFRSPKKYLLVATGTKTDSSTDGNLSITTWKSDIPLAAAGFAFGDYKYYAEKAGDVEVQIYANKQGDDRLQAIQNAAEGNLPGQSGAPDVAVGTLTPAAMVKPMAAEVTNMVRLFEAYFGPFPFKHLAVTNIPYSYGQGWPSLLYLSADSFLDSTQRHELGYRNQTGITDFFRAHETSHQWWGHRVGWKSYHDQWLSEGFAQFSGNLYVQFRQNVKEYENRLRRDREELLSRDLRSRTYESLGPVWMGRRIVSSDSPGAYQPVVYNKGGWVLHMLRMMMWDSQSKDPDHRFIEMMKDFTQTYDNKAASTEDFREIAEKHMVREANIDGRGLEWFFRQYVYGIGIPEYQFNYKVESAGAGKWRISGTVVQSGVPDGWRDVIPLYIQTGGKTVRIGNVAVRGGSTPFEGVLPIQPEKVVLAANSDTIGTIRQ